MSEPARIDLAPRLRQRRSDDGRNENAALGSEGESFYALRELRDGDDWSRVHALRSAALGTPVRVLRRGAAQPRVRVVLDLRSAPTRLRRRNLARLFEWGLSATASLVEHLLSNDRRVDVEVLGDGVRLFADLGQHTPLPNLLEFLAQAQPRPWQAAPAELLGAARAEGELFWVLAGPFLASGEREQLGPRAAVWEQAAT